MEKKTEQLLNKYLENLGLEQKCIYYSPSENEDLKILFKHASKNGIGRGVPDRIYYDGKILMIFECKALSENKAYEDLIKYKNKLEPTKLKVFYCSFVGVDETTLKCCFYDTEMKRVDTNFNFVKKTLKGNKLDNKMIEKVCHEINNDIRNKTKLNDADKPFFISAILLCYMRPSFTQLIKDAPNYEDLNGQVLSEIILNNLKRIDDDKTFYLNFNFLETHLDNKQLYHFCRKIYNTIIKNYNMIDRDILNNFYNEFTSYSGASIKLGIVLTPDHIVKLMIKFLELNQNDIFLDLCSGSGSFGCEAFKHNIKEIICCEFQASLYALLKTNFYLRDSMIHKLYNDDCFNHEFKATKSAINPPYSSKNLNERELQFVIKQLDSLEENGICCSIIPISCITENKQNLKYKTELLEKAQLKCVVKCNKTLFTPMASVEPCILVLQKTSHNQPTLFIDYSNDEITIEKHIGKVKTKNFQTQFDKIINIYRNKQSTDISYLETITSQMSWIYNKKSLSRLNTKEIKLKNLEIKYKEEKEKILNSKDEYVEFSKTKPFYIEQLFEIKKGNKTIKKCQSGIYPLISASGLDNGITGYISEYTFEGNCLSVASNGSVGKTFYQPTKFSATTDVAVLIPKFKFNHFIGMFFCQIIEQIGTTKYSYGYKFNMARIKKEVIDIPIDQNGDIDFHEIENKLKNI